MIKKVFLVLITSSLFLFFSCGSTKPQAADVTELEPPVETEEVQEQTEQEQEEEDATEDADAAESETNSETQEESQETEEDQDINLLYPPLDEIEEPDLIELPPEEKTEPVDEQEEEKNKITEPVEEIEELPPLPESDSAVVSEDAESTEGSDSEDGDESEDTESDETENEGEGIEPTIEIEPEEEAEPEPEIIIVPSRSVSLKKGETLVITYPGNGWIYMGSTSEYNNLASRGRKLGTTDTKYTLLAKESGTQIHHFYKVDNLTGDYIDDYIEVTVLEKKGKSSTVVNAPDYSEIVPKKPETPAKATPKPAPKKEPEEDQAATETSVPATDTTYKTKEPEKKTNTQPAPKPIVEPQPEPEADAEDSVIEIETEDAVIVIDEDNENAAELESIMEKARSSVSSKKYDDAYPALVQYLELSTDNRDEALYLLGQILESNSKYRDIKQAVETYQTLCDNYPASKYWDKANKRIVYLKRFYINIH